MIGTKLGHYEITSHIGSGGMGDVYQATDTKLGRSVAIKLLPEAFSHDIERVARFQREARVLASLNHPNIAGIHGVGEIDSRHFLVMELVPGETLADRIKRGALPIEEALPIAKQVAEALEEAHEKGVIHRDLKPANIKVTPDGKVKVLDFGLAKAYGPEQPEVTASNSPTMISMAATNAGIILGTAAYMSPEQAAGKPVDRRADIWSFGVVMWEILTGNRLFEGETVSHTLAAVLTRDPDWSKLPSGSPPAIRRLLRRCLQRDLKRRLPAIGVARLEIEDAMVNAPAEEAGTAAAPLRHSVLPWAVAILIAVTALGFVAYRRLAETAPQLFKLSVTLPENVEFGLSPPAVSPDGRHIAFVAHADGKDMLWVRDFDALSMRVLAATEGADHPFWSPDGRYLGFFAGGKLKKIAAAGGPPVTIGDAIGQARGGTWSGRDVIVFAPSPSSGLFKIPAAGGNATLVKKIGRFPWFLPDGRHFLYIVGLQGVNPGLYFADLDSDAEERVPLPDSNAVYASPGYLLFLRDGTLMAQPFDAGRGKTTGEAVPIAEQVGSLSANFQGQFSASQDLVKNAVLVYTAGSPLDAQLTWYDRSGNVLGTVGKSGSSVRPAIALDDSAVATDRGDPQTGVVDVWLFNLLRGTESRFTFGRPRNLMPMWSPDGSHIAFNSQGKLYEQRVSGSSRENVTELLDSRDGEAVVPLDWTHDGRYIIEQIQNEPKPKLDIWLLPLVGARKAVPYLRIESNESTARVSPNDRWLAYASDESKRFEIYVQSFPNPGDTSQVSADGGTLPVWSRDGKELFFIAPDGKMMAVEVKGATANDARRFEAGRPRPLFDSHITGGAFSRYDVSNDGRFLIPAPVKAPDSGHITVVINWAAGLKK